MKRLCASPVGRARGRGRRRRGFSMLEALTSSVILGVGVLAVSKVYVAGAKGRTNMDKRGAAVAAVRQRLETLTGLGAENLPACPPTRGCRGPAGGLRPVRPPAAGYPCTQVVREMSLTDRRASGRGSRLRLDTAVWRHRDARQRGAGLMVEVSACWFDDRREVKTYEARRLILDRGRADD